MNNIIYINSMKYTNLTLHVFYVLINIILIITQ